MITFESRFCPICDTGTATSVLYPEKLATTDFTAEKFSARRLPDGAHFRLVKCSGCGLVFSDPACSPDLIRELYVSSTVNYDDIKPYIYRSYASLLKSQLPKSPSRKAFLEIGGGDGFMLQFGIDAGFESNIEVEPSRPAESAFKAMNLPRSSFIQDIYRPGLLPPSSVSMACAFHVLDHVPSPLEFVSEVFNSLEPGGMLVLVTHNTNAFSARMLKERSPIFDIEHTYLFNLDNIHRLLKKAGFSDIVSRPFANAYPLSYWCHLAPVSPGLKKLARNTLRKIPFLDIAPPFYAGNLMAVGYKQR